MWMRVITYMTLHLNVQFVIKEKLGQLPGKVRREFRNALYAHIYTCTSACMYT